MSRWLETAIGTISPAWAARREEARLLAEDLRVRTELVRRIGAEGTYLDAARRDRTSADWPSTSASADGAIVGDLTLVNARARAAVWTDWAGRSIVGTYRRHVVGIGITPRSAARDPGSDKETPAFKLFNRRIDRLYKNWAHRPWLCDVERTKPLAEIDGLAVSEFATVGEAFCVHSFTPRRGQVGLAIQMYEPEQLDWSLTTNRDNGNAIRGGIEIDDVGAAVAFWVFTAGHPLDGWGNRGRTSTRIPADRVYHVVRQERVRQSHGLSQLAAVLEDVYQLKGYKQAEAVGKRLDACVGLNVRHEAWYNPETPPMPFSGAGTVPPTGGSTTDARGNPKVRFEPGMIADAGFGRYFESHTSQRPGAQYDAYVNRQTDQIAAGADVDGAHMTRNFSNGTYTSQRQGLLELDRVMDPIQFNLIIDQWAGPRREAFKLYAVLQGLVKAPGMFESDEMTMAYLDEDWAGPPKPWVDPRNQAQATRIALEDGLTDLRHEKNVLGGDYRDALGERATEQDLADELGVRLPWLGGAAATPGAGGAGGGETSEGAEDTEEGAADGDEADKRDRREREEAGARRA